MPPRSNRLLEQELILSELDQRKSHKTPKTVHLLNHIDKLVRKFKSPNQVDSSSKKLKWQCLKLRETVRWLLTRTISINMITQASRTLLRMILLDMGIISKVWEICIPLEAILQLTYMKRAEQIMEHLSTQVNRCCKSPQYLCNPSCLMENQWNVALEPQKLFSINRNAILKFREQWGKWPI